MRWTKQLGKHPPSKYITKQKLDVQIIIQNINNKLSYILIEVDAAAKQASALISDKLQTRTLRCQRTPDILVNCKFVISFKFQTPDILVNCEFVISYKFQTPDILINCKFVISYKFQTPDILVNCNFLKYTIWQNCKNFNIAGEFIFFRLKMPSLIVKTCKIVKCHTSSYFLK